MSAQRTVLVLHDEELAPDLAPLDGLAVRVSVVAEVPEVWGEEVYGAPADAAGARGLAARVRSRASRALSSHQRIVLLPRTPMPGEAPTVRHWMSAALLQVEALLDKLGDGTAVAVVGPRAEAIGWHLVRKRPALLVVAVVAGVRPLLADRPSPDELVRLAPLLVDPSALVQALPAAPVAVVREEGEVQRVELRDGAVVLVLPASAPDPAPVLEGPVAGVDAAPAVVGARLLIGAAGFSGQAAAWSAAARTEGLDVRSLAVVPPDAPYPFPADVVVSATEWTSAAVRARLAARELLPATHVLAEAMRPIVGLGWPGRIHPASIETAAAELEALLASGRTVGVVLHGSEARTPERHLATYPFSPFSDASAAAEWEKRAEQSAKVHAVLDRLPVRRFVTTPDMLEFVDGATWLPLALGPGAFRTGRALFAGERPVVLHAPSAGPAKGSAYVEDVLRPMHEAGLVDYRLVQGVPPWELPAHLRDADLVIDQLVLGGSGVLAAQAMAAGRVVLGHVAAHVRARYDRPLPIVEADPVTLADALRRVLDDREAARATAAEGAAFAREQHDGRRSTAVLRSFVEG